MGNSVFTDVQQAEYEGVSFDAQIVEWTDTRGYRFAMHEYLKRDGGESEPMGRKPHRVHFNLVYVGTNWRQDYQRLQKKIDEAPLGLLVHPLLGRMNVQVSSIGDSRVNAETGINTVYIPIEFVESNVNQRQQYNITASPSDRQQAINTQASALNTATAIYATASAALSNFMASAVQFGAAAAAAVTNNVAGTGVSGVGVAAVPDYTLPTRAAQLQGFATVARNAIRSDPAFTSDAWDYTALGGIELLLDACNQLDDAVKATRPVLVLYTVPTLTTLIALAQAFYGGGAADRLDEIRTNNPGKIPNPAAIAAGTTLLMAPATVRQLQQ